MNFEMWYHASQTDWFFRWGMIYPVIAIVVLFWIFAMGACFGSFLNVCIWRIPRGESLSKASSHCTTCGTPIHWYDNLPILSYLILHGKCRYCRSSYSASYFVVESICSILFVMLVLKTGWLQQTPEIIPAQAAMIFFGIGCAIIDWKHQIIPDKMTYSMMVCALLFALLLPGAWGSDSRIEAAKISLLSGMLPASWMVLFILAGKLSKKENLIGYGDVKFVLGAGMLLGLPGIIFALIAGAFSGCCAGVFLKRKHIVLGPHLAAGCLIWIFAGNFLLEWYKEFCLWMGK